MEIQIADIERDRLSAEAGSIDVVIANQILEHTKEVFWIFDQVARSLRVGGHFILGVPNLASLHNRLLLLAGRQPTSIKNNSAHLRGFTKKDILALAAFGFPEGFELEGFGGSNFYPFPGPVARPMARALPTLAWGIFFSLKKSGNTMAAICAIRWNTSWKPIFGLGHPTEHSPIDGASDGASEGASDR